MTGPCQLWPSQRCVCVEGLERKRVHSRRQTCLRAPGIGRRRLRWIHGLYSPLQHSYGWTASMHRLLQVLPILLKRGEVVGPPGSFLGRQLHCLKTFPSGAEERRELNQSSVQSRTRSRIELTFQRISGVLGYFGTIFKFQQTILK